MPHGPRKRIPILAPVDRVSEIVFGVLMALTFTGTVSVATAGREEIHTMMYAALGCNLAWGLADAVMYLVRSYTERQRKLALLEQLRATRDQGEAHRLIIEELPPLFAAIVETNTLQVLYQRLLVVPMPKARLGVWDYAAGFGVFALVVFATFPVVIPFVFVAETALALRVSNALAVGTLFICGCVLGYHSNGRTWLYGFLMSAIGIALVVIIVTLGG